MPATRDESKLLCEGGTCGTCPVCLHNKTLCSFSTFLIRRQLHNQQSMRNDRHC